jgi:hypothetical protein
LERAVAWSSPYRFGRFGECKKMVKEDEKLEEKLAAEMSIGNLKRNC